MRRPTTISPPLWQSRAKSPPRRRRFADGWIYYEYRRQLRGYVQAHAERPLWNGSDLHGRTILLHAEQGLGDTIQFIRYAPLVKQRGGTVLFECPPALVPLLKNVAGVDQPEKPWAPSF